MVSIAIVTNHTRRGFTLVELLVAIAVGSLALTATMSLSLYSLRSFAALTNYVDLDNLSRNALDQMTREIRQADRVLSGSDKDTLRLWVTPYGAAGREVVFEYDPRTENVTRTEGSDVRILLRECFNFSFSYFQRKAGVDWEALPATSVDTCKQVRIFWECSRTIMGERANTESVQSAKVVIRKR
jgi:prepilin-type N-terminal cleavage/methylation domain-containing protein